AAVTRATSDVGDSPSDWDFILVQGGRVMTVDELDSAYQAGIVDERTMVCWSGSDDWKTLGEMAGIKEAAVSPPEPVRSRLPSAGSITNAVITKDLDSRDSGVLERTRFHYDSEEIEVETLEDADRLRA